MLGGSGSVHRKRTYEVGSARLAGDARELGASPFPRAHGEARRLFGALPSSVSRACLCMSCLASAAAPRSPCGGKFLRFVRRIVAQVRHEGSCHKQRRARTWWITTGVADHESGALRTRALRR